MIAIINYGLGNLTSIKNMCNRLGIDAVITSNEKEIISADKLILPGVGHFNKGMENLKQSGLQVLLNDLVLQKNKPILGICLGAQLMTIHSEEANIDGLGWVDANTVKFDSSKMNGLKIPHMGWADIEIKNENLLLMDLPIEPRFYHVHT
jgi:imidazole glycerol-phosphate synthase subunit HisH